MFDFKRYMDSVDRKAYHEGEFEWEEDGYKVTRTYNWTPPGCHDSCGVLLYTKDGELKKIEGDPLSPYNNGKLCMRCLNMLEAVNDPKRVTHPLKRVGERGENKWEQISWDEACEIIKDKVTSIWEEYGPQAICAMHGTGRNVNWQLPLLAQSVFLTPNVCMLFFSGAPCYIRPVSTIAILGDYLIADASQAFTDRYSNPDWRPPEVIVIWGNEPLVSNGDGYLGHWLNVCVQLGSKIICIDPRLTWWGARADVFLQIRPGTDAALAMAFLNVIIEEKLCDYEFIDYWCTQFDELAEMVKDTTPEWAAEVCWLDADAIREAARMYAKGNNSAIQWGLAFDQQRSAMQLQHAVTALMAITGNIDKPGGNTICHDAFNCSADYDCGSELIPPEVKAKKLTAHYGFGWDGQDCMADANADAILHAIETGFTPEGDPYPIKMVWFQGENSIACPSFDAGRSYEALKKVDFIVVADPIMTPSAVAFADLVLPIAMSVERDSARSWWYPIRTMKKVCSCGEAISDEELVVKLGHVLNPELFERLGWNTAEDLINWFLAGADGSRVCATTGLEGSEALENRGCGYTFKELNEKGGYLYDDWNAQYEKYAKGMIRQDGSLGFATYTGRVELVPGAYTAWGLDNNIHHTEPVTGPITTPDLMKKYPLIFSTGGRSWEFFHSEHRQYPLSREFHPHPLTMVHPQDAERYGIQDGEWIWIENMHGRFLQKAKVTKQVRPGIIHCEHGWWYPEKEAAEPELFAVFDSNPNNCIPNFETGDFGLGLDVKAGICRIYPYAEGDVLPGDQIMNKGGFGDYKVGSLQGFQTELK